MNEQHWTNDKDLVAKAWVWLQREAKDFGLVDEVTEKPWADAKTKALYDDIGVKMDAHDLLVDWKQHVSQSLAWSTAEPVTTVHRVGHTVTRNYGPVAVSYSLECEFDFAHTTPAAARAYLDVRIEQMHSDYVRQLGGAALSVPVAGDTTQSEVVEFEKLSVSLVDGKLGYKLKGGKYDKWGVRVWPEVLKKVFNTLENFTPGEHPVFVRGRVLLSTDGKPQKVVSLENA